MTVEHTLQSLATNGALAVSHAGGAPAEVEVVVPRALAAADLAEEMARGGEGPPSGAEVTAALDRAEAEGESLAKPFIALEEESSSKGSQLDFVAAFVELVNRGFYGPGSARVLERLVVDARGDMRWRVGLQGVEAWALQAFWLAFGWFRRDGGGLPEEEDTVFLHPPGAAATTPGSASKRAIAEVPGDPDIDLEELLDCKYATLRLHLSREPDDVTLREIYRCLELWQLVVAPGFPRYGGFMTPEERPALDAPLEVALELPVFRHCDPRALIPIKTWIAREGARLGIASYELEAT
jgi:hypothetical protein